MGVLLAVLIVYMSVDISGSPVSVYVKGENSPADLLRSVDLDNIKAVIYGFFFFFTVVAK